MEAMILSNMWSEKQIHDLILLCIRHEIKSVSVLHDFCDTSELPRCFKTLFTLTSIGSIIFVTKRKRVKNCLNFILDKDWLNKFQHNGSPF
uniref:Uncharacterized protein n=1 Tax=viral metagenome TaxID=1070528 RepID=A0A6C0CHH1_9ZZZZ